MNYVTCNIHTFFFLIFDLRSVLEKITKLTHKHFRRRVKVWQISCGESILRAGQEHEMGWIEMRINMTQLAFSDQIVDDDKKQ